ncbi:MAG TPA: STAS/SEC14 domain-containing protein [Acidimicrobiales bacterium]|nr:STAS/SEC14 domain-containing protein [Acidimicrobiales bacterium]
MLERIESPEGVLAFRAVGKVTEEDYRDVLTPAVQALIAERGEVRLLYVLGDEFEGYASGAGWEDTKLGLGHWTKWKRVALVTNHEWVRHAIALLGWVLPGEVKVFDLAEDGDALAWAASPA